MQKANVHSSVTRESCFISTKFFPYEQLSIPNVNFIILIVGGKGISKQERGSVAYLETQIYIIYHPSLFSTIGSLYWG